MSDLKLSPFYHSAVNAVTKPNKLTHTSDYFLDRWMPLLGGNGTMIVLALRRGGFLNRKTGERRDEILISRTELAAAAGLSEDTLTRELGINKKTGKPQNEWLHHFVQKRSRSRRNGLGQVRQEESAYWVSMDDPVHPDDWHLVEEAAREAGWRQEKRREEKQPETQSAFPVDGPETQNAAPETQSAADAPQNALPETQNASHLKSLDSSLLETTFQDAARPHSDLTSSLFSEMKEAEKSGPEQKAPEPPHTFAQLTPAEQQPYLDRAERELQQNFGLAAWRETKEKARAQLCMQRAANLCLAEKKGAM